MKSYTLVCALLFYIVQFTTALEDAVQQETVVVLQRNVTPAESLVYPRWYHPHNDPSERMVLEIEHSKLPEGVLLSEEYFYLDDSHGSSQTRDFKLKADEDTTKYCVSFRGNNATTWTGTTCESKLNWMYDRKDLLGKFTIPQLVIPGTHQSAAYINHDETVLSQQLFARFAICQSRSIKKQLEDGIRYLDLRPGIDIVDGKPVYNLYHGSIYLMPLAKAVQEINKFLDTSKDIVIVSFKEFPKGFETMDDHRNFQTYLENAFKEHAYAYREAGIKKYWWEVKLDYLWDWDKRLIVSYYHDHKIESDLLWPKIYHVFADARTEAKLQAELTTVYNESQTFRKFRYPHAAMIELTYNGATIAGDIAVELSAAFTALFGVKFYTKNSLRDWADFIAPYMFEWFTQKWSTIANVIAVDFYEGSGVVDLAIQLNVNREKHWISP